MLVDFCLRECLLVVEDLRQQRVGHLFQQSACSPQPILERNQWVVLEVLCLLDDLLNIHRPQKRCAVDAMRCHRRLLTRLEICKESPCAVQTARTGA